MKVISFRDLKLADELKHLNEVEMLFPENDALMHEVLWQCGFDPAKEIEYVPSKHRDMQGKVAIGFQAIGSVCTSRKLLNSCVSDITDRMCAAAYTDPSLTRELASMMGNTINYKALLEAEGVVEDENNEEPVEEDYEWTVQQIMQLQAVHDMIRGNGNSHS
jgi:hypothetical protein